jgi:hypothetical protein
MAPPYGPRRSVRAGAEGSRQACLCGLEPTHASAKSGRPSRPLRSATLSTQATVTSRFAASAATRIRRSRSASCAGRRRCRFMSSSAIYAAEIAPGSAAIPTSAATWWPCGLLRSRRTIRRRQYGRANADGQLARKFDEPTSLPDSHELVTLLDAGRYIQANGRQRGR